DADRAIGEDLEFGRNISSEVIVIIGQNALDDQRHAQRRDQRIDLKSGDDEAVDEADQGAHREDGGDGGEHHGRVAVHHHGGDDGGGRDDAGDAEVDGGDQNGEG